MGATKRFIEEFYERGWSAPEKMVCADCVEDKFLKHLVSSAAESKHCDYCGKTRRTRNISVPVEVIMPAISSALNYFYAEPTDAGVPYEGGWLIEPTDTEDALSSIPFEAHEELFADVVDSFSNQAWVEAAGGHWASSHRDEDWSYSWLNFTELVKHRSRYFFLANDNKDRADETLESPLMILETIANLTSSLELINKIPTGTRFYRVRERDFNAEWDICSEQLGAPPNELAQAGRMNPAGISYMYLATEPRTAIGEVLHSPPCRAAIGVFESERNLFLLDLTKLPDLPSVFDGERHREREAIVFLSDFIKSISQPIRKDGREHVSYVPSQVVSEYFAQVFKTTDGKLLDGITYPSSVQPGGKNIVLFPQHGFFQDKRIRFVSGRELCFETWKNLTEALIV